MGKYHNLMHLTWVALALGASFMGVNVAKRFCIGSGVFYLALAIPWHVDWKPINE